MPLPILSSPQQQDLLRLYARCRRHYHAALGEETELEVGTAITNPQRPEDPNANCLLDATGSAEEHFAAKGVRCLQWFPAPGTEFEAALNRGADFIRHHFTVYHMPAVHRLPELPSPAKVKILPARAALRQAEEWDRSLPLHLDDPHFDALLTLDEGRAVGGIGVLAMGDMGLVTGLRVDPSQRGRGIGRAMVGRALEIAARSLFRHVFVALDCPIEGRLYQSFGFKPIGQEVRFRPAQSGQ